MNCVIQIQNFIKISPLVAELFHADKRTDRHDEANSGFRNFAKAPQKVEILLSLVRRFL